MLGSLWHAPKPKSDDQGEQPLGASTIGSSEACMLGGLALKRRWQVARKKAGKPTDKPNLVLGANAQVCIFPVRAHAFVAKRTNQCSRAGSRDACDREQGMQG